MKTVTKRFLPNFVISMLLIIFFLFSTSCSFDPDEAVNIKNCVSEEIVVQKDSTMFYFYYNSEEHSIEEYDIIKVRLEYYVDYHTTMKKKNFFITVPDDVKYGEQPYFTVEIDDILTNESVVYISVLANYKTEGNSRTWAYVITIIIAVVMLAVLWSVYMAMCDAFASNTILPSSMWLGGIIIYIIITLIIGGLWGTGPGSIIIVSGILYFIFTLFTFYKYKE